MQAGCLGEASPQQSSNTIIRGYPRCHTRSLFRHGLLPMRVDMCNLNLGHRVRPIIRKGPLKHIFD